MGLDTVELVMAIEEEFGIEIPNEHAARISTVGEMHAYLIAELGARGQTDDPEAIYTRLRNVIVQQTGVAARDVVPTARFVEDLHLD